MKALKEKRLSLRSFLRRGLVILSLFALVFASCAGSDEGGTETPTNPPPTNPPSVISITVSGRAGVETWFQGTVPDPTGLTIKALWADGPNAGQIIEYKSDEFAANNFYISPNILDEPGAYPAPGDFRVVHKYSGTVQSQSIDYEGVIPITGVTGGSVDTLYADKNPLTTLIGTPIKLNYIWDSPARTNSNKITAPYVLTPVTISASTKYDDKTIYMNSAYPLWDLKNIADKNSVNLYFGYIKQPNTANAQKTGTISVKNYMQVVDIQVDTFDADKFFVYDDDVRFVTPPVAGVSAIHKDLNALLDYVTFKVAYQKGKAGQSGNNEVTWAPLTWAEFKENVAFAKSQLTGQGPSAGTNIPGSVDFVEWGNAGLNTANRREAKAGWPEAPILFIDEEDTTWKINLEYVPRQYLLGISGTPLTATGVDYAYVGHVNIRIPVAEFQNEITVKNRHGLSQAQIEYQTNDVPMTQNWLNAIADRWVLTGQYNLGSKKLDPKEITWASSLFQYGHESAGVNITLNAKTLSGNASWASFTVNTERDFALPIYFRGETATEDDTVLVEIFRKSINPTPGGAVYPGW